MKTEQEQIKAMANVLCDYCKNNTNIGCKSSKGVYICTSEIQRATALVQAGYGDVSEYKAEIIKQDQVIIERNFELVELEDKIKQAQIDVLKRLKVFSEPYPNSWGIYVIDVYHIDELIKEIEEQ